MEGFITPANGLTAARMMLAVLLLFTDVFSPPFYLCYLLGALTDAVDGAVARARQQVTALGAKLDTAADFLFVAAVMGKVIFHIHIPAWLIWWTAVIAAIKAVNMVSGFCYHRRIVVKHTALNKVTGVMLFFLPITLGINGFPPQILVAQCAITAAVATVAAIQEGHLIRTEKSD